MVLYYDWDDYEMAALQLDGVSNVKAFPIARVISP